MPQTEQPSLDSPRRKVAVVLVHGLFSSTDVWDEMGTLASEDPSLKDATVYRFSYSSKVLTRGLTTVTPTLDDVADSLRTYLRYSVVEPEVVLATHSQGGLVALRMVAEHLVRQQGWGGPTVRLLLLYACPHFGSSFGLRIRRVFFSKHAQAKSLAPLDGPTLQSIRSVVRYMQTPTAPLADLKVIAVAGATDGIVTPDSAKAFWSVVETVPGDHSSIVRPSSAGDESFLILRRQVAEVLIAPVTNLTLNEHVTADSLWQELVDEVASRLHFASWDAAYGGLVRTTHVLPSSVLADLHGFSAWLLGRIFPVGHPEIRRSLESMGRVVVDLLNTFNDNHTEVADPESENPYIRVAPWYKTGGFNPNYGDDLADFLAHVNLLANLTFEMTRIANWFSDLVRAEIDPHFHVREGVLLLEVGPVAHGGTEIERPIFEPGEVGPDELPYSDIETFRATSRFRTASEGEPAAAVQGDERGTTTDRGNTTDEVEHLLLDRQMRALGQELQVYRDWGQQGTRDTMLAALRLGIESGLVSPEGFRSPVWETSVHLRFVLDGDGNAVIRIEEDGGVALSDFAWEAGVATIDAFSALEEAMRGLGVHLGTGLFLPTKNVQESAEALEHAARYRSQTLNSGSEYLTHLIELVEGWYITQRGVVSREHPYYFISRERVHELDWEQHVSDKGWEGIHAAMRVSRALFAEGQHPRRADNT
ncbi:esterase/lipase family protein [Nocardioides aequoreus]|uniref:esterase/lipase family protein n=1 Tax=Nocardioides aequoreus TaxID=397278 RepID=UPI0012F63A28|nr:alpha/beta fold hydrolase [Nocardioides aequoreus]